MKFSRSTRAWTTGLATALLLSAGVGFAAERPNIVDEGDIAKYWQPAPGESPATPAYPGMVADKSDEVCVNVGYMVNRDGSTSDFSLLKAWSAKHPAGDGFDAYVDPFARNALASVQRWRFVPSKEGSKPRAYYTAATFAFSTSAGADATSLRGHCQIESLAAFIAKAQEDAYRRGNLKKNEAERYRQQDPPNASSIRVN